MLRRSFRVLNQQQQKSQTPQQQAANLLIDARRHKRPIYSHLPPSMRPATEAAAYEIQDAFLAQCRPFFGKPIGWKIGAGTAAARSLLKLDQCFAGALLSGLHKKSTAAMPANVIVSKDLGGQNCIIESEVALVLGENLFTHKNYKKENKITAEHVRAATAAIIPSFEIVSTPFKMAPPVAGGLHLICDNGALGQWIEGYYTSRFFNVADSRGMIEDNVTGDDRARQIMKNFVRDFDAVNTPVTLKIDGEVVQRGRGGLVEGGAFEATAWLANFLAERGLPGLRAGEIITTGTATPATPAKAGQTVEAEFGDFGLVKMNLL